MNASESNWFGDLTRRDQQCPNQAVARFVRTMRAIEVPTSFFDHEFSG